jgi:hypothetical protein
VSEELHPQLRELIDMVDNPEELDAELAEYLEDGDKFPIIRHPLVYAVPYIFQLNKRYNEQLRQKVSAVQRSKDNHDWMMYVMLHERPHRVNAFVAVQADIPDAEYWEILADIWQDSENIRQNPVLWETLLTASRGSKQFIMSEDEREALAAMPDRFTVYQGHTFDRDDGWSWTTDEKTAVWFARRFAMLEESTPLVTVATVDKSEVVANFLSRGEHEIIVDPDMVELVRVYDPGEQRGITT